MALRSFLVTPIPPSPIFWRSKCCGLKSLTSGFACHLRSSDAAQFFVNQGKQFAGGAAVTLLNRSENARDLTHKRIGANGGMSGNAAERMKIILAPSTPHHVTEPPVAAV